MNDRNRVIHDLKVLQPQPGDTITFIDNQQVTGISKMDIAIRPREFLRVTIEAIDTGTTIIDGQVVIWVKLGDKKYRLMECIGFGD